MIEMTKDELKKLVAGFPPSIVNRDWDYETVIKAMASKLLAIKEESDD